MGAYYLHPPDARTIFLHNDLLCNGTCSVTGGRITYWGGTNGKDPYHFIDRFKLYEMLYEDVVLGGPRTSQYSPCFGEGPFLI